MKRNFVAICREDALNMVNTVINILTIALPVLAGLYSFWSSCKKDGFDQEKAFDLVMAGTFGGVVFGGLAGMGGSRLVHTLPSELNLFAVGFGFAGLCCLAALKWKWSVYRILDNMAMALTLSTGIWLLGQNFVVQIKPIYFVAPIALFAVYGLLQKYRLVTLKSGFTFCLVGGVFCLAGALSSPKLVNLIFIGLLATLVVSVLIFRLRSLYGGTKKNGRTPVTS